MLEASILVIGDEILGGFVHDTNSPWLAERLREHSVPLTRVHVVPDDFEAIDEALQSELRRSRPRIVLTTGGVGSTPDDVTYEAVAASLGLGLEEQPAMADRVRAALQWTERQGVEVDDEFAWHMHRMARVPAGASVVSVDSAWVPGVRVDRDGGFEQDGQTVVILPGVPSQVRAIVRGGIEPLLHGWNEELVHRELVHSFPESALNLCFARLMERYPDVKLGSYPGVPMVVRLSGRKNRVEDAYGELRAYVTELESDPGGARLQEAWVERFGAAERDRR